MSYPVLTAQKAWYKGSTAKSDITTINIVNSYTVTGNETESWNADVDNSGIIKCYITGTVLTIAGNGSGKIACNPDSYGVFSEFTSLVNINGANILDTSGVTTFASAFSKCTNLESVDVSTWDTSSVTSMQAMFQVCVSLKSLNLSRWDVRKVKDFKNFIYGHSSYGNMAIASVGDLSGWQLLSATTTQSMFQKCPNLRELNVSNFGMGNVTTIYNMFYDCPALEALDVSRWDVSKVTSMRGTFYNCLSLTTLDVSNWDTSSCTELINTFCGCTGLTTLDVSDWDTSSCTELINTFYGCTGLTTLDVSNWDTSKVTTLSGFIKQGLYGSASSLLDLDVSIWDVSSCIDMTDAFYGLIKVRTLDCRNWDTSKVQSFHHTFSFCHNANIMGVEDFDVSSVVYMNAMFHSCHSMTRYDVSRWDVSKVQTFAQMFENNTMLTELIGLENWDTSSGRQFAQMFLNNTSLRILNLSSFDTRNASDTWVDPMYANPSDGTDSGMREFFDRMENLREIILGENFSFDGDGTCIPAKLPIPNPDCIPRADGKWYTTDGSAYSSEEIPNRTNTTYIAIPSDVNVSIKYSTLTAMADAVRKVTKKPSTYSPSEMVNALHDTDNITNADTVDGWHFAVRDDGTPPPSGVTNTMTLVYTGG